MKKTISVLLAIMNYDDNAFITSHNGACRGKRQDL